MKRRGPGRGSGLPSPEPVMEEIISMSDMGLIFEVTDGYGIDRESIRVDLAKEDPGSVRKGEAGMIEITVPLTTSLEHWLPTLDSRLTAVLAS